MKQSFLWSRLFLSTWSSTLLKRPSSSSDLVTSSSTSSAKRDGTSGKSTLVSSTLTGMRNSGARLTTPPAASA